MKVVIIAFRFKFLFKIVVALYHCWIWMIYLQRFLYWCPWMVATNGQSYVPLGFQFHPTDEELLHYYLRKKVSYEMIELNVIQDVDMKNLESWDLCGVPIFWLNHVLMLPILRECQLLWSIYIVLNIFLCLNWIVAGKDMRNWICSTGWMVFLQSWRQEVSLRFPTLYMRFGHI